METAERIKIRLESAGWAPAELATEITRRGVPVTESAVRAWLSGRNEPKTAAALAMAAAFGTTVEEMFGAAV